MGSQFTTETNPSTSTRFLAIENVTSAGVRSVLTMGVKLLCDLGQKYRIGCEFH